MKGPAMPSSLHFSRRRFLGTLAAAGTAGPAVLSSALAADKPASPSDRITLGIIGMGIRARQLLGSFLNDAGVQVVAVCDVVRERRDHAQKQIESHYARRKGKGSFPGCKTYNDFRDVLARKDIDAVLIA